MGITGLQTYDSSNAYNNAATGEKVLPMIKMQLYRISLRNLGKRVRLQHRN